MSSRSLPSDYTLFQPGHRILYTHGDAVLTPTQYRSSFEMDLERSFAGRTDIPDETLARAYAVSATAYACTEYCATTMSGIQLHVGDPTGERLEGSPLTYFLSQSPLLLHHITTSLHLWGRGYLRKQKNKGGWPTGLQWINPVEVAERTDGEGRVLYYDVYRMGYHHEQVETKDIVYMQMFDSQPGGNGLSKFEIAWRAIGIEQGLAKYAAAWFVNSARPDGMLSFDHELSEPEFEEAKKEWLNFKGSGNAHKTAVMPGGARWTPVQTAPKDVAMHELKADDREDICAIFNVNPILVGLQTAADRLSAQNTYSGVEINHIRSNTLPMLKTIIIPALNEQWAHADFSPRDTFTLAVDEHSIPALAEANLTRSQSAIQLTGGNILDYDESRTLVGYPAREDYLRRNPADALALWEGAGITLNLLRRLIGLEEAGDNGEVIMIGGQLLPVSRLAEIANKNADNAGKLPAPAFGTAPTPPSLPPDAPTPKALPAPTVPILSRGSSAGTPEAYAILSLANDPQLIALQNKLRALLPNVDGVRWTPPNEFHVTLVYATLISDDQLSALLDDSDAYVGVTPKMLTAGPLDTFDQGEQQVLILPVEVSDDLARLQGLIYERLTGLLGFSVPMSEYSVPENWQPHITLAYLTAEIETPELPDVVGVIPQALEFSRGDYATIQQYPFRRFVRNAVFPLELAISFAEHQFVRYARRALSEWLSTQEANASWMAEQSWRLTLVWMENCSPADAARMIRQMDYSDMLKLDLSCGGYFRDGDDLYLRVQENDALARLRRSAELDTGAKGGYIGGIKLGSLQGNPELDINQAPATTYPLVAGNLMVWRDDHAEHVWSLRGVSQAQSKELENWERVIRRKGREHSFTPDALMETPVAAFVRAALAAEVDITEVFDIAVSILRGEWQWRSYEDTRFSFVEVLTDLIRRGFENEVDRRNFAAQMRVQLRRFGLQALQDGINEGSGTESESIPSEALIIFRAWQAETSAYITNFGAELFQKGIQEADIEVRAGMWANKSLDDIYYAGYRIGGPNKMATWRRNPQKDSCDTCVERDGKRMTMNEWGVVGFPRDRRLDCGGWECGCDVFDDQGNKIGRS